MCRSSGGGALLARIEFAPAFRRHVDCPADDVSGATLGAALAEYFDRHPAVRGYVLDDRGRLRRHVTVFVDQEQVDHAAAPDTPLGGGSSIHVFQALSGG